MDRDSVRLALIKGEGFDLGQTLAIHDAELAAAKAKGMTPAQLASASAARKGGGPTVLQFGKPTISLHDYFAKFLPAVQPSAPAAPSSVQSAMDAGASALAGAIAAAKAKAAAPAVPNVQAALNLSSNALNSAISSAVATAASNTRLGLIKKEGFSHEEAQQILVAEKAEANRWGTSVTALAEDRGAVLDPVAVKTVWGKPTQSFRQYFASFLPKPAATAADVARITQNAVAVAQQFAASQTAPPPKTQASSAPSSPSPRRYESEPEPELIAETWQDQTPAAETKVVPAQSYEPIAIERTIERAAELPTPTAPPVKDLSASIPAAPLAPATQGVQWHRIALVGGGVAALGLLTYLLLRKRNEPPRS